MFTSFNNCSAQDIDNLQIRPVKYTADLTAQPLAHIYNLAVSTGTFPRKMQFSKVNLIFKGGEKNNLSNYRPISILPVFSKGLEKLLHARISSFVTKFDLMNKCQYGFRKGRFTELALLTQKEIILHAFDKKQLVIGVYIRFFESVRSVKSCHTSRET